MFDLCGVTERHEIALKIAYQQTAGLAQLCGRSCASSCLHTGVYRHQLPIDHCPVPEALVGRRQPVPFLTEPWFVASQEACLTAADALLEGCATWFSNEAHEIGSPPDWFLDPASGQRFPDGRQHWSRCKPFASADIKCCWELSRWGWAPLLARAWRLSGDSRYLDGLNAWSQSWCQANPVNGGCNWLCGSGSIDAAAPCPSGLAAQRCTGPSSHPTPKRAAFVGRPSAANCCHRAVRPGPGQQPLDFGSRRPVHRWQLVGCFPKLPCEQPAASGPRLAACPGAQRQDWCCSTALSPSTHSLITACCSTPSPRWSSGAAGWIWSPSLSASLSAAVPLPSWLIAMVDPSAVMAPTWAVTTEPSAISCIVSPTATSAPPFSWPLCCF